jgi:hypothetical protein
MVLKPRALSRDSLPLVEREDRRSRWVGWPARRVRYRLNTTPASQPVANARITQTMP